MATLQATDEQRPLRMLLVSDDDEFAGRVLGCATARGLSVARVEPADDLEIEAFRHGANVLVLDADKSPRGRIRAATAFASSHPRVTVALASTTLDTVALAGLPVLRKKSAENLLRDVDHVRRGPRAEPVTLAGAS